MTKHPEPDDPLDWSPATSKPGEVYTPEGQIKSAGAFARGLTNHDPRARKYQRSMMRPGLYVLALAVAFVAAVVLLTAVF
jgi:hypothetical protein